MIWITGYAGSGKSYLSKNIKECQEFDEIETIMTNEGYNLKGITKKEFKKYAKNFLNNTKIKALNGVQAYDYYKKGDKVFFIKTNLFNSLKNCMNRNETKRKIKQDFIDNFILFFKLKILYIKVLINKDLIKTIDELKAYLNN